MPDRLTDAPRRAARIVVAPNAFKGSLTAAQAASAMTAGVRRAFPAATTITRPIADGGDGSVDALVSAGYERLAIEVRGPTGLPVSAAMARSGSTVVVEIANTCGLLLLPEGILEPLGASSAGLGDAVRSALDSGADHVVICLGGSSSTDGGAGLLSALGAVLLDDDGTTIDACGAGLLRVAVLDLSRLDHRIGTTRFTVATDVTTPLLGPDGAAAVFGPQKGATPDDVALLDAGLTRWADALAQATGRDEAGRPGSGAAGGTGVAALAALDAHLVSGAALVAEAIGLSDAIDGADLVVTGEGALDRQSTLGKGALAVVDLARSGGADAILVCGRIDLTADELLERGVTSWASLAGRDRDTMGRAADLVAAATAEALARWSTTAS
ncbi:MAG: glycerate kinase [Actinobacteria bacterium]|nr:glycerate kinase [Actinomycetota bacterium]